MFTTNAIQKTVFGFGCLLFLGTLLTRVDFINHAFADGEDNESTLCCYYDPETREYEIIVSESTDRCERYEKGRETDVVIFDPHTSTPTGEDNPITGIETPMFPLDGASITTETVDINGDGHLIESVILPGPKTLLVGSDVVLAEVQGVIFVQPNEDAANLEEIEDCLAVAAGDGSIVIQDGVVYSLSEHNLSDAPDFYENPLSPPPGWPVCPNPSCRADQRVYNVSHRRELEACGTGGSYIEPPTNTYTQYREGEPDLVIECYDCAPEGVSSSEAPSNTGCCQNNTCLAMGIDNLQNSYCAGTVFEQQDGFDTCNRVLEENGGLCNPEEPEPDTLMGCCIHGEDPDPDNSDFFEGMFSQCLPMFEGNIEDCPGIAYPTEGGFSECLRHLRTDAPYPRGHCGGFGSSSVSSQPERVTTACCIEDSRCISMSVELLNAGHCTGKAYDQEGGFARCNEELQNAAHHDNDFLFPLNRCGGAVSSASSFARVACCRGGSSCEAMDNIAQLRRDCAGENDHTYTVGGAPLSACLHDLGTTGRCSGDAADLNASIVEPFECLVAFRDVPNNSKYTRPVVWANQAGVIVGYPTPDGPIFAGSQTTTRAELLKMAMKPYLDRGDIELLNISSTFNDTNGHWAEQIIATAAQYNMVRGYPGNDFRPDQPVTVAESLKMVLTSSGREHTVEDEQQWPVTYMNQTQLQSSILEADSPATRSDVIYAAWKAIGAPEPQCDQSSSEGQGSSWNCTNDNKPRVEVFGPSNFSIEFQSGRSYSGPWTHSASASSSSYAEFVVTNGDTHVRYRTLTEGDVSSSDWRVGNLLVCGASSSISSESSVSSSSESSVSSSSESSVSSSSESSIAPEGDIVFSLTDYGTYSAFADFAGDYWDSGLVFEGNCSDEPVYTNGIRFVTTDCGDSYSYFHFVSNDNWRISDFWAPNNGGDVTEVPLDWEHGITQEVIGGSGPF